MTPQKILQITSSYPPPRAGWGVRIEFLKKHLEALGHSCVILNVGKSRTIPSTEYETVLSGMDYLRKVWHFSRAGYVVHAHVNGESPKGFVLTLVAEIVNLLWGQRCFLTFHAGVDQLYFPRPKWPILLPMYWVLFAIPRCIICNSEAVKQKVCEYGVPPEKIVAIPAFSSQYLEHTAVPLPAHIEAFYQRYSSVIFTYIKLRPGFYQDVLLDGFAIIAAARPSVGLAICGLSPDIDEELERDLHQRIARSGLGERICLIDDLDHAAFLTAIARSSMYLRTPTSDGVASSVLEALCLGVPVVASANGARPDGVITYHPTAAEDLAAAAFRVLDERDRIVAELPRPMPSDTLREEACLLTSVLQ